MAKPNYAFEKRQRELEKQRKKTEKAQRKAAPGGQEPAAPDSGTHPVLPQDGPAPN